MTMKVRTQVWPYLWLQGGIKNRDIRYTMTDKQTQYWTQALWLPNKINTVWWKGMNQGC